MKLSIMIKDYYRLMITYFYELNESDLYMNRTAEDIISLIRRKISHFSWLYSFAYAIGQFSNAVLFMIMTVTIIISPFFAASLLSRVRFRRA